MWHYNCEPSDRKGDAIICSETEMMCIRCGRRGDVPSLPQAIPICGCTSRCQRKGDTNVSLKGMGWMGWREYLRAVASLFCYFFPYQGTNIVTRTDFAYRVTTSNSQKSEHVNNILAGWGHRDWTISNLNSKTQSLGGLVSPQKYAEEIHGPENL